MRVPHTRGIELDGLHHTWFRYEGSRTRGDEPTMLVRGNKFNGSPEYFWGWTWTAGISEFTGRNSRFGIHISNPYHSTRSILAIPRKGTILLTPLNENTGYSGIPTTPILTNILYLSMNRATMWYFFPSTNLSFQSSPLTTLLDQTHGYITSCRAGGESEIKNSHICFYQDDAHVSSLVSLPVNRKITGDLVCIFGRPLYL